MKTARIFEAVEFFDDTYGDIYVDVIADVSWDKNNFYVESVELRNATYFDENNVAMEYPTPSDLEEQVIDYLYSHSDKIIREYDDEFVEEDNA